MEIHTIFDKIIFEGAAAVHQAWCDEEMAAYNSRLEACNGNMELACYKNNRKRNEIINGKVCRFKDGEDILVPFAQLSLDAQEENLNAAEQCFNVYYKLKQAGMTDEQMLDPANNELLGTIIHTDWMERNTPTSDNNYLFVPYSKLGDWEKGQDLTVFRAVLAAVNQNNLEVELNPEAVIPTIQEVSEQESFVISSKIKDEGEDEGETA